MTAILAAAGVAILAAMAALTATRYPRLPERIPTHFRLDGRADAYGPRPRIWLLVGVAAVVAALYGSFYVMGASRGTLVFGDCILAACACAQLYVLAAAASRRDRIPIGFWGVFVTLLCCGVAAQALLR